MTGWWNLSGNGGRDDLACAAPVYCIPGAGTDQVALTVMTIQENERATLDTLIHQLNRLWAGVQTKLFSSKTKGTADYTPEHK
jgi:hypothetical protein